MKGDFTRFRFDPLNHRRRVYDQQGRVGLDADENESVDIAEYLRAVGMRDVVGPSGGPLVGAGFAVTVQGGNLGIGAGRYWVGGLLVENESTTATLLAQPNVPAGASVVVLANGSAGAMPPGEGVYVGFLETWERLVTAAEDDSLREPALGGPDTTVRTQQVWQVRLLRAGDVGTPVNCLSVLPAWDALVAAPTARMAARSAEPTTPPDDCAVPADAGFRGTENQHYRVEIHEGGGSGTATFKWSRENGSVVSRWVGRTGNELTVSSPGRDGALGFAQGDWVELIDESRELTGTPGTLVQLESAGGDRLEIRPATATGTVDLADFPDNPRVRRWDSDGEVTVELPPTNDGWIQLELGVEVRFPGGGSFRTGQWWSVPARTALGDVIWPAPGDVPAELPPFGDRHYFARVAIVQFDAGAWTVLDDCRELFPPLTGLESLFMLGGDGQEALPDVTNPAALVALADPLRVGVANGETPVSGARVQFSVTDGNGQVNGAATAIVPTGADGVASAAWSVESATAAQTVTARLLDAADAPTHLPVQFNASLSLAAGVAYVPGDCADLAGARTVQEALDILCQNGGDGCATLILSPGDNWPAPLLALPAGANARICFRPGVYTTAEPVVVANKGSLVISGAGLASRVETPTREVALLFRDCDEVVIRDLAVSAQVAGTFPERPGLTGALTLEGCRRVVLESLSLTCGAGTAKAAGCLTVRSTAATRPEVVRVRDCDLVVGHLQVGALLLDAAVAEVTGTTVRVAPKPASLSLDVLLTDRLRQASLVRQLIGRPLASGVAVAGRQRFTTRIQAGGYTLAFNSNVPQAEWQALADAHPPTAEDTASVQALQQWATNLSQQALAAPAGLPTFRRQVQGLRRRIGDEAFGQISGTAAGQALLHSTLVGSDFVVLDPGATAAPTAGSRTIQVGNSRVTFDSVLSQQTWQQLLAAGGVTQVGTGTELKQRMSDLARQVLVNPGLRAQVPGVASWFAALAVNNPAVASAGIVVGGGVSDALLVADNQLLGMLEAVHVGLSAGGRQVPGSFRQAGKVEIRGNRATVRVPVELEQGPRAYFVGNARHAIVTDNEMSVEGRTGQAFLEGVRVWGQLGSLLRVADNLLPGCETGVRVQPQAFAPPRFRWNVTGNVAPDAEVGVSAPPLVTRSANVPA